VAPLHRRRDLRAPRLPGHLYLREEKRVSDHPLHERDDDHRAIADHLVAWRPFAIEITLYGLTKETYERLTGIEGSYDRCMRGIRLLIDRGLPSPQDGRGLDQSPRDSGDAALRRGRARVHFKYDSMINRASIAAESARGALAPENASARPRRIPSAGDEWIQFAAEVQRAIEAKPISDTVYQRRRRSSFAIDP